MKKLELHVPTYNATYYREKVDRDELPEFGDPEWPVLIHESAGVRVILGTDDIDAMSKPDIQIERQPNGWVIFLHPLGGSDPSGYVYFHDDGRSWLLKEHPYGPTPEIEVVKRGGTVPEFDGPPSIEHHFVADDGQDQGSNMADDGRDIEHAGCETPFVTTKTAEPE